MEMNIQHYLIPIALLLVPACDEMLNIDPQEDYKILPNVFCVLRPEQSRQWLLLERTMQMTESTTDVYSGRSWGARVVMESGGEKIEFAEDENEPGNYFTDSLTVVPGRTYQLTVVDRYQNVVTGETIVPEPIKITEPRSGFYSLGEKRWVEWTKSPNAAHYVVYVHHYRADGWGMPYYFTADKPYFTLLPHLLPYPGDYLIEVVALDENYYRYTLSTNKTEATQDRLALEGGLGLFGSAVADSVKIVIGNSYQLAP
ncbi:DUF4249 family protein [candidate division KSB1 bacterium]